MSHCQKQNKSKINWWINSATFGNLQINLFAKMHTVSEVYLLWLPSLLFGIKPGWGMHTYLQQSGCRTVSIRRTSVRVVIENSSGMPQLILTCEMKCLPKTLTSSFIFCQLALFLACSLPIRPFSDQFATQFFGSRPVNGSVHFLLPSVLKICQVT